MKPPPPHLKPERIPLWYKAATVLLYGCGHRVQSDKRLPLVASIKSAEGLKK